MAEADAVDVNRVIEKKARVANYVVDADQHVTPPPTFWAEYLSPEFRDLAPTVESDDEFDYVVFEGQRRKINLMQSQAGRKYEQYKNAGKQSDMRVGGWMPEQRLSDMDRDGIDKTVVFGGGPLGTGNLDLYLDSFKAFNRWQSDFCAATNGRVNAVSFLTTVDVDHTIEGMREAKARGDVAVNLPAFPQNPAQFTKEGSVWQAMTGDAGGDRSYRDPEFDPLWAASVELDLPLTFHLGARVSRFKDKTNFLPDLPMGKVAMLEPIGIFIYSGIFDRFPELRLGIIESGVGWMPWAADYMDRNWTLQKHWTECDIKHAPSYYFDQNVYASFISDPVGVRLRDLPGCKNIMWSSDYPHSETTFPNSHVTIEENFAGVPQADRDWIISGCAEKFFGLK
ncbi:MAG: amidohydrolase family protein [Novosphingobium sp.]|nr:amidohydrolase family protein [Novosphingobium sp.]